MKDLYSAHTSAEDLEEYYNKVKQAYLDCFAEMGIPAIETLAAGGVFTTNFTHEFQALSPIGEDAIYICDACHKAVNEEIIDQVDHACPDCKSKDLRQEKSIEVGNIFNMATKYSEQMGALFTDKDGTQKPFHIASYGIGISRAMATIIELHNDDKGIIWPESVAPKKVHLVGLSDAAEEVYKALQDAGIDVLFDDRATTAGEKFLDADLLGMPVRLTVGSKTPAGQVEWKNRDSDDVQVISLDDALAKLKG